VSKTTKNDVVVLSAMEEDLLTLLHRRSFYGMEFVTAIKQASDGRRDIGFGSLYPTLTRMEKKNLVSWRWGDEQSGPRRKYYDITPYGRAVLEETWKFRQALREVEPINVDAETLGTSEAEEQEKQAIVPVKTEK
jgi:PadR family transcriptional regulator, regulatory protein PadR